MDTSRALPLVKIIFETILIVSEPLLILMRLHQQKLDKILGRQGLADNHKYSPAINGDIFLKKSLSTF